MPGIQEKHAVLQQLGLRQFSFLQHPGQQIGLPQRTAPAVGNQAPQISRKFNHRLVAARVLFGSELGFQGAKNRQGPAAQRTAILTRDAQQVANHLDRDGGGEVLDEIEMLPSCSCSSSLSTSAVIPGCRARSALGLSAPTIWRRTRVWYGGSLNTRLVV